MFITREAEKQRKKEEKERAKNLKIWEKKTATSMMPLKRVKEDDIKPLQSEENLFNYNSTQRGYISNAMHIAKSRVQYPRETRPQNINEFINQKKEMFLVEMAYNTIKEEITALEKKTTRKREAINESQRTLEKDNEKLVTFIDEDNKRTTDAKKEADRAMGDRKKMETKIKDVENKIQALNSEIDKNMGELTDLETHKRFLFDIFLKVNKSWAENKLYEKERKTREIKRQWIDDRK